MEIWYSLSYSWYSCDYLCDEDDDHHDHYYHDDDHDDNDHCLEHVSDPGARGGRCCKVVETVKLRPESRLQLVNFSRGDGDNDDDGSIGIGEKFGRIVPPRLSYPMNSKAMMHWLICTFLSLSNIARSLCNGQKTLDFRKSLWNYVVTVIIIIKFSKDIYKGLADYTFQYMHAEWLEKTRTR